MRYVMEPMRFKKIIYKVRKYVQDEKIYKGTAPAAPLLNSQYTSSFIAGLTELRYLHCMPLENTVEYFRAHGFDLDKGTAQKLVSKVKIHLKNLYKALDQAIVADHYICGDETYQKVQLQAATPSGRKIKKGYIWVFVGMTAGLVYFFYDDGSRSAEVFKQHIKGFKGAFQCDYYSEYRHIGISEMSGIKRLPCIQHIKRKFLDLKDNPQAQEIARLFGLLYHFEHQHRIGKDGWTEDDHLQWRQRYSKVMLEKIRMRLTAVKDRIGVPPDDPLLTATEHALRQWDEFVKSKGSYKNSMETIGLQRRSEAHNKAMKNDESDGCLRRVHSTNLIIFRSEYHLFNCNNAVQLGPLHLEKSLNTQRLLFCWSEHQTHSVLDRHGVPLLS